MKTPRPLATRTMTHCGGSHWIHVHWGVLGVVSVTKRRSKSYG